jgi:hypothetical protein
LHCLTEKKRKLEEPQEEASVPCTLLLVKALELMRTRLPQGMDTKDTRAPGIVAEVSASEDTLHRVKLLSVMETPPQLVHWRI